MTTPILLYAEDEEGDVFFMRYAFDQFAGSAVLCTVSTGPEALDYLSGRGKYGDRTAHPFPTAVLLDINLPGCSGFDVLKWIRAQAGLEQLPVVMFSSSARLEDIQRARELGATDYLEKPPSGLEFLEIAEKLMRSWMGASSMPTIAAQPKNLSIL